MANKPQLKENNIDLREILQAVKSQPHANAWGGG